MKALLCQLDESATIGRQIGKHVRELIVTGQLAAGERLPSTQELADLWNTHVTTVHRALTPLVHQGLITRTRRVGTFVRPLAPKLTRVGVYYPSDFWLRKTFAFSGALHAELLKLLQQSQVEVMTWVDPRDAAARKQPWDALLRAAQHREIQALIVPAVDDNQLQAWLSKVPLPSAYLWNVAVPSAVAFDQRQFIELSLQCVADHGGRSVGLISPDPCRARANRFDTSGAQMYGHLVDRAGGLGLSVRNDWVRFPQQELTGEQHARFGYDQFRQLWQQRERPEALVIWPDSVAPGVLMAIAEQGVRVPQELRLVLQKSDMVELFCPVPASFVVASVPEMAAALWEQIRRQSQGERCRPILVPFQIQQRTSRPGADRPDRETILVKPFLVERESTARTAG